MGGIPMTENWYVNVDGNNYGPYNLQDLRNMLQSGQLRPDSLLYHQSIGAWYPANQLDQFNEKPPPHGYKLGKKPGCLKGFLISILVVTLVIGALIIFWPKGPANLQLEKGVTIGKASVDESGGIVDAGDILIEIPENAFDKKTSFKIKTKEIKNHNFGQYFNPITPVFNVDNKEKRSKEPMTVTIPINIQDHEFAMAFYYNKDGSLEPLPLIYQDNSEIIVATTHFSDLVITKILIDKLMGLDIDTAFRPGVDDWSFANYGSQISPGGHCAGQSVSMGYYYNEIKSAGDPGLNTRYDNNTFEIKTPQLDRDDSLGIRLASVMQEEGDWDGYYWDFIHKQIFKKKYVDDRHMFYAFAYHAYLFRLWDRGRWNSCPIQRSYTDWIYDS